MTVSFVLVLWRQSIDEVILRSRREHKENEGAKMACYEVSTESCRDAQLQLRMQSGGR